MLGHSNTDYSRDVGFLLSQLGYRSAALLAEQLSNKQLTAAHAGIMRAIAAQPGQCQRALSAHLGVAPSRIVAYVDDLERRGYVERRRHQTDRRLHALHFTDAGEQLFAEIAEIFRQREHRLISRLEPEQSDALREMLRTVARQEGLTPLAHPAYRTLGDHPKPSG
ncbi:MAG: MarR family winged helix-turn-helix transcriptional regulator [Mycobacterium sp.]